MRRIAVRLAMSSLLAFSAAAGGAKAAEARGCAGADSSPTALGATTAQQTTLCLLNRERRARGLRPLRFDGKLGRAARGHSGDMVARRYFGHRSKSGATLVTRIRRTGWTRSRRTWTVAENIAYGSGGLGTPREIVRSWMRSSGHRSNILSRSFDVIGIGIARGIPTGGGGATYTTDFGG